MTEEQYKKLVDIRNSCYRKRRDENKEINYFTGFNDGYEIATKELQEELEKWKAEWQAQVQEATEEGYARTLLQIENEKLKEQIDKMKCCSNCTHNYDDCEMLPCRNLNHWKMMELAE